MIFVCRVKEERSGYADIIEKSIAGTEIGRYKGSEVRACSVYTKKSMKTCLSEEDQV